MPCLSPPLHVNDFAPSDGLEIHATFVQEFCQGAVFRRRVEIVMRVFFAVRKVIDLLIYLQLSIVSHHLAGARHKVSPHGLLTDHCLEILCASQESMLMLMFSSRPRLSGYMFPQKGPIRFTGISLMAHYVSCC